MTKRKLTTPKQPTVPYNKEVMKNYPLTQLQKTGRISLSVGEIVALKCLAIRKGFVELASKLRGYENKIIRNK